MAYTLDYLIIEFKKHEEIQEIHKQKAIDEYQKNYPEVALPEHLINSFSISRALLDMCTEIKNIKDIVVK